MLKVIFASYRRWKWFISSCLYRPDKSSYRWKYPLRVLPLINLIFDLFFDDSVISQESCTALLDIMGLLNALLLGGVLSLCSAVGYEDLVASDELWWVQEGTGNYKYWHYWYDKSPSSQYYIWISNSLVLFFVGVLIVVYVYADSVAKASIPLAEDEDEDEDGHEGKVIYYAIADSKEKLPGDKIFEMLKSSVSEEKRWKMQRRKEKRAEMADRSDKLYAVWWNSAKYAVFLVFFTTTTAVMYSLVAVQVLFAIKYPDYYIAQNGVISYSDEQCPTGHLSYFFSGVFAVCCAVTVLSTGSGTAARYSLEDNFREEDWFDSKLIDFEALQRRLGDRAVDDYSDLDTDAFRALLVVLCEYITFLVSCENYVKAAKILALLEPHEELLGRLEQLKKSNPFTKIVECGTPMSEFLAKKIQKLEEEDMKTTLENAYKTKNIDTRLFQKGFSVSSIRSQPGSNSKTHISDH